MAKKGKPITTRLSDLEKRVQDLEHELPKSIKDGEFVTVRKTCSIAVARKLSDAASKIGKLGKK